MSRLLLQCFFLADIFVCASLVPLPALSVQSVGQKLQIGFLLLLDLALHLHGMMVHKKEFIYSCQLAIFYDILLLVQLYVNFRLPYSNAIPFLQCTIKHEDVKQQRK